MQPISTVGLDIAKSVFQVHGVDAAGRVVIRRQLRRRNVLAFFEKLPPCLVGIEACASSHHWSRELQALVTQSFCAASAKSRVSPGSALAPAGGRGLGRATCSRLINGRLQLLSVTSRQEDLVWFITISLPWLALGA
jgi:hypothetical protein